MRTAKLQPDLVSLWLHAVRAVVALRCLGTPITNLSINSSTLVRASSCYRDLMNDLLLYSPRNFYNLLDHEVCAVIAAFCFVLFF